MPRQIIYFSPETLEKLKIFLVKRYGAKRALSITVERAVNEYLERQKDS